MMRLYPDQHAFHERRAKRGQIALVAMPIVIVFAIVGWGAPDEHPLLALATVFGAAAVLYQLVNWVIWRRQWDAVKRHALRYKGGTLLWRESWYDLDDTVRSLEVVNGIVKIKRGFTSESRTDIPAEYFDQDALDLFLHEALVRYALEYKKDAVAKIQRLDKAG